MPVHIRTPRYKRRTYPRAAVRLRVETLETRCLPSVTAWPGFLHPVAETEPNDTLDQAQNLGDLSLTPRAEAVGTIGNGTADAADVDWYSFQLDRAAHVTLTTPPAHRKSQAVTTLSLYNSDPNDFNDPFDPIGYRLLGQADSAVQAGGARLDQRLAPGTYYVAVSGSGNHYFHPFMADSGSAGATGDYGLLLTAANLGLRASDGPAVLAADPQPGATLDRSPFMIRVDVSGPLDPRTVSAGRTVQLFRNANGTFGDGNDQAVTLASTNLNIAANELLIAPAAPLAPGYYQVVLSGNSRFNPQVLADTHGIPLGTSGRRPSGMDFTYTFHIVSNEGRAATGSTADDTPAGAHQLGDLSSLGLLQIPGAIGDDSTDAIPFNPAGVDLYHFHITGPGNHAFLAEVFAGRIGSPLNPGLSLFQAGAGGQLQLIAANNGTLNGSPATDGTVPLYNDSVLYAGLTQGDYYLAVSGTGNVPDPVQGLLPGTNGVFDPNVSHSGQAGYTTGPYLLNLHVQQDDVRPQVVSTTLLDGDVLSAPPTNLRVQFSKPINLQQVAYSNFHQTSQSELEAVYVLGSSGVKYYPRLLSYDGTTQQAQFLMLDGLPNDTYELHLSGSGPFGLADLAGNALTGNDASGDYVVHFTVNGPQRGTNGNPLQWFDQEPNDTVTVPQDLGVLFPHELQAGVTVTRDPSLNPGTTLSDTADYYRFQLLQSRDYILSLSGSGLPAGALPTLTDAAGNAVSTVPQGTGGGVRVSLDPGTYVVGVGGWSSGEAPQVTYQLRMSLGTSLENPTPLTIGPAPAYRIALAFNQPAPAAPAVLPTTSPVPTSPAPTGGPSVPTPPPATQPTASATPPPAPTVSQPSAPSTPPAASPVTSLPAPANSTSPVPAPPSTPPSSAPSAPTVSTLPTAAPSTPVSPPVPAQQAAPVPAEQTPASSPSSAQPSAAPSLPATPAPAGSLGVAPPVPAPATPSGSLRQSISAPSPNPSASVPRLDISVPAEAINSAGILLIANYRTAGEPSSFAAIPSEVLLSLSALPVGGVRGVNRSDLPFPTDRVQVRSAEQQIRPTSLNQPSVESETNREAQNPLSLPHPSVPASVDAMRQSGSNLSTLFKSFAFSLQGVWRSALDDLFMNGHWQGRLSDWLEKLPSSAPPASLQEDTELESTSEKQDGFEAALLDSFTDEPLRPGAQSLAYAGLLLGMAAVTAADVKKQHAFVPAERLSEANGFQELQIAD